MEGTIVMANEVYEFELTIQHYLAFLVLIINFLIFFFYKSFYKYSLLSTILLGLFNVIRLSLKIVFQYSFIIKSTHVVGGFFISFDAIYLKNTILFT
ncbi:hypothetical protein, partial [Arcicella rigui]